MKREGPWMAFFGDAFFESERVVAMSPAAGHLYLYLIWHEYKNGPFSAEPRFLRRLCSRFEDFDELWLEVAPCFRRDADGRLSQHRCEAERALDLEISSKRSKAAFRRWEKLAASKSNASAVILQCPTDQTDQTDRSPSENPPTPQGGTPAAPSGGGRKRKPKETADIDRELAFEKPWLQSAAREWVAYRTEKRLEPYTTRGFRAFLGQLQDWGEVRVKAAMRNSMSSNYQGLIEPKVQGGQHQNGASSANQGAPRVHSYGSLEWCKYSGQDPKDYEHIRRRNRLNEFAGGPA